MNIRIPILAALVGAFAVSSYGSIDELLPEELENAKGEPAARETLDGKLIGVYFSAGWCGPCRAFTPSLVEFRNEHKDEFEVVFVSADNSPEDQRKYMADYKMDFLAVEHSSDWTRLLVEKYSISGIPTLVIIDSEGNLITRNGRGDVTNNAETALASWQEQIN